MNLRSNSLGSLRKSKHDNGFLPQPMAEKVWTLLQTLFGPSPYSSRDMGMKTRALRPGSN
jgi:hypothetical protein